MKKIKKTPGKTPARIGMQIEVGPHVYRLKTVPGPLKNGRLHCGSVCNHRTREILISDAVPAQIRAGITAIAVAEAWKHETRQRPPIQFVGDVE